MMKILFFPILSILVAVGNVHSADCSSALADCIGTPSPGVEYNWDDPAIEPLQRDSGLSDQRWRSELERRAVSSGGPEAAKCLIELGLLAAFDEDSQQSENYYQEAAKAAGTDALMQRRLAWSRGQAHAALGDFEQALRSWHAAAESAESKAKWVPAAYAHALWALDRNESALAWYSAAVRSNVWLGRATQAASVGEGTALGAVSRALVDVWSKTYAPLQSALTADVDIGPDGRLSRIVFEESKLDSRLLDKIRLTVMQWRFDPVIHDDKPATLSTHIYIDVRGRPATNGNGHEFEVQYAGMNPLRRNARIRYPKSALRRLQEGEVKLKVDVNSNGRVIETEVVQSSGAATLDHGFRVDVSKWEYEVDRINGVPQSDVVYETAVYRLSGGSYSDDRSRYMGRTRGRDLGMPHSFWYR